MMQSLPPQYPLRFLHAPMWPLKMKQTSVGWDKRRDKELRLLVNP